MSKGLAVDTALWLAGCLILSVALFSPIHPLGETFLWAHMVQHMLILFVAAPLMAVAVHRLRQLFIATAWRLVLWFTAVSNAYIWHWPRIYEFAVRVRWVHDLQHVLYVVTGIGLWLALMPNAPLPAPGGATRSVAWLVITKLAFVPLGLMLLIGPQPLYPGYAVEAAVRGWSPHFDQQLAGLIMLMGDEPATVATLATLFLGQRRQTGQRSEGQPNPQSV